MEAQIIFSKKEEEHYKIQIISENKEDFTILEGGDLEILYFFKVPSTLEEKGYEEKDKLTVTLEDSLNPNQKESIQKYLKGKYDNIEFY